MSAVAAAIRLSRDAVPLRAYRCTRGGWHLTKLSREEYETRVREHRDEREAAT